MDLQLQNMRFSVSARSGTTAAPEGVFQLRRSIPWWPSLAPAPAGFYLLLRVSSRPLKPSRVEPHRCNERGDVGDGVSVPVHVSRRRHYYRRRVVLANRVRHDERRDQWPGIEIHRPHHAIPMAFRQFTDIRTTVSVEVPTDQSDRSLLLTHDSPRSKCVLVRRPAPGGVSPPSCLPSGSRCAARVRRRPGAGHRGERRAYEPADVVENSRTLLGYTEIGISLARARELQGP